MADRNPIVPIVRAALVAQGLDLEVRETPSTHDWYVCSLYRGLHKEDTEIKEIIFAEGWRKIEGLDWSKLLRLLLEESHKFVLDTKVRRVLFSYDKTYKLLDVTTSYLLEAITK